MLSALFDFNTCVTNTRSWCIVRKTYCTVCVPHWVYHYNGCTVYIHPSVNVARMCLCHCLRVWLKPRMSSLSAWRQWRRRFAGWRREWMSWRVGCPTSTPADLCSTPSCSWPGCYFLWAWSICWPIRGSSEAMLLYTLHFAWTQCTYTHILKTLYLLFICCVDLFQIFNFVF